ncbi:MAG: UPF0149 family protein [Burkholderiaceae bacterium]|nr:UPF0149 family protein [Roseateles sp.]MBV8469403.1 UPF0149 family protein [Burkholderiaceae bacterium]
MEYPHYNPNSDHLPLSDEELAGLDDMLGKLPSDAAMNIEAMDGYLTALLVSPRPLPEIPGAAWLPVVWGGDVADSGADTSEHYPFVSGKQRKRVMMLVLRHLNSIAHQLRDRPQAWEPIFSIAEDDDTLLTDAEDWCIGFMTGVDQAVDAWAPWFKHEFGRAALAPIALLGSDDEDRSAEERASLADPHQLDAISREVPEGVLNLRELIHPSP